MDRSGTFQWTNLQLDRTTHWTAPFATGPDGPVANWSTVMEQSILKPLFFTLPGNLEYWEVQCLVRSRKKLSSPEKCGPVRGLVQLQIGPLLWTGPFHL